jgi:hypothetical protein
MSTTVNTDRIEKTVILKVPRARVEGHHGREAVW